ncbi:hypothetical protein INT48_007124 [Thamnidium elegans]|uniref:Uncharacterized protein n=1 Tax=Thamnidium elegans TaxID=101142 RepID=A0A8H7SR23_9FUNG|nr:hypothetical protein INT48_007124 [Thamnidium elegans]
MEGVLTEIIDPNIVPVTITSQAAYLTAKPEDKEDTEMQDIHVNEIRLVKSTVNSTYRSYDGHTSEKFINRMIEVPVKRGRVVAIARNLGVKPSTANIDRPSNFTGEHVQNTQEIVEKDSQLCCVGIIDSLTSKFEGFSISKSQMNHHLKNNVFIFVKKPTFEPKKKNLGTPAIVEVEKTRSPSHTIFGAIHPSKTPINKGKVQKAQTNKNEKSKKRKPARAKDQRVSKTIIGKPVIEYVEIESSDGRESNKPPSKVHEQDA